MTLYPDPYSTSMNQPVSWDGTYDNLHVYLCCIKTYLYMSLELVYRYTDHKHNLYIYISYIYICKTVCTMYSISISVVPPRWYFLTEGARDGTERTQAWSFLQICCFLRDTIENMTYQRSARSLSHCMDCMPSIRSWCCVHTYLTTSAQQGCS